jgi:hypothetical protein
MPTQATYDDANLILRLYELRREEKLRQAREWFAANFHASTIEEMHAIAPPGSKEHTYLRMVVGYWDMAAALVTSGVLNQALFFETNGELLFVWERIKALIGPIREMTKYPKADHNIEEVANAYIKYLDAAGPEVYAAFSAMVRGVGR